MFYNYDDIKKPDIYIKFKKIYKKLDFLNTQSLLKFTLYKLQLM